MDQVIRVRGARTHNLKNLDIDILTNAITCLAGPSGSGKTSLAFHTLLMESKRRFINSFPNDVKFFWDIPQSVDVDEIFPILPVWGLPQNNPIVGARPCVFDLLGIGEDLARLFFIQGGHFCPEHLTPLVPLSLDQKIKSLARENEFGEGDKIYLLISKSDFIRQYGDDFLPARSFGPAGIGAFNPEDSLWEVYRFKWKNEKNIKKEKFLEFSKWENYYLYNEEKNLKLSFGMTPHPECPECSYSLGPKISSDFHLLPTNAYGACASCQGHGMNLVYDRKKLVKDENLSLNDGAFSFLNYKRFQYLFKDFIKEVKKAGFNPHLPFKDLDSKAIWSFLYEGAGTYPGLNELFAFLESKRYKSAIRIFIRSLQTETLCSDCQGTRMAPHAKEYALFDEIEYLTLGDLSQLKISDAYEEICYWEERLKWQASGLDAFQRAQKKLEVSIDLGVGHLCLNRRVKTLSASEYQRILLNKFLSFQGSGSLFIFDEPGLGLGLEEQAVLYKYLNELKKQKNTILMVEHSEYLQKKSDEVIEMGPGAGHRGGEVLYQGKFRTLKQTYKYPKVIGGTKKRIALELELRGGLKRKVDLPIEGIVWVRGKSGSGKTSTMIEGVGNFFCRSIGQELIDEQSWEGKLLKGSIPFKKVLRISGYAEKYSSRSTVGTFLGIAPFLRKIYADLNESKKMGLKEGHFSPNSDLGKCTSCEGRGIQVVDMNFLEDLQLTCEDCQGMKIRPSYALMSYKGVTFYEAVSKPMEEVFPLLKLTPKLRRIKDLVLELNLGHLALDRALPTLSGGEKQRLRLVSEINAGLEESAIFFEDISFGLSRKELQNVLNILASLSYKKNLLVLIDQNPCFSGLAPQIIDF